MFFLNVDVKCTFKTNNTYIIIDSKSYELKLKKNNCTELQ